MRVREGAAVWWRGGAKHSNFHAAARSPAGGPSPLMEFVGFFGAGGRLGLACDRPGLRHCRRRNITGLRACARWGAQMSAGLACSESSGGGRRRPTWGWSCADFSIGGKLFGGEISRTGQLNSRSRRFPREAANSVAEGGAPSRSVSLQTGPQSEGSGDSRRGLLVQAARGKKNFPTGRLRRAGLRPGQEDLLILGAPAPGKRGVRKAPRGRGWGAPTAGVVATDITRPSLRLPGFASYF